MKVSNATSTNGASAANAANAASGAGNAQQSQGTGLLDAFFALLGTDTADGASADGRGSARFAEAGNNDPAAAGAGTNRSADAPKTKASLTSDLTAGLSANTLAALAGAAPGAGRETGTDSGMVSQLEQDFGDLAQSGPVDANALAGFRSGAVALMKAAGFSNDEINQTLVALAAGLGGQLTALQAGQLAMPLDPPAGAAQDTAAPAIASTNTAQPPSPPGQNAAAQPPRSRNSGDAAGKDNAQDPRGASAQVSSADAANTGNAGNTPNGARNGAPPGAMVDAWKNPAGTPAAQGQPAQNGAAPPTTVNSAGTSSQGGTVGNGFDNSFNNGFTGGWGGNSRSGGGENASSQQQPSPGGAAAGGVSLAPAGANFVNYLSSGPAGASPTTQFVALQTQRNLQAGTNTFTVQLDPAELGRLEVRMKFDKSGGVTAHLSADKPETLTLLQKDAPQLQRLLQQSGFSTGDGALSFDLRQQGQGQAPGQGPGQTSSAGGGAATDTTAPVTANLAVAATGIVSRSGVNIMV